MKAMEGLARMLAHFCTLLGARWWFSTVLGNVQLKLHEGTNAGTDRHAIIQTTTRDPQKEVVGIAG